VETFDISFGEIRKAPTEGNPKIIWLEGDFNPELTEIKNKTEEALSYQKGDFRKFAPHITLARIKKPKETLVGKNINKKINLMVPVRSVEIMESLMERGGRAYYMLDSVSLEE
jgi:2'-5' RNA ligase